MSPFFGFFEDTYVQITLRNASGEDIITNRTATRSAQYHPVYAERFPFTIQENFLEQLTINLTVIGKRSSNKIEQEFGTISFGRTNESDFLLLVFESVVCTGREATVNAEMSHWQLMLNAQGETITRWHILNEKQF